MAKKTVKDLDLKGQKVFIRVDFNVPIKEGKVRDDLRIREALPTIRYCLDQGATVILASHLGRPDGKRDPKYTLAPVAGRLSDLLGKPVKFVNDCIGPEVEGAVAASQPGDVILLENVRYYPNEEANDPGFAAKLAAFAPIYINDAFGSAHRAHASTEGMAHHAKQAAAGFLMEKELRYLGGALENPDRPFVSILGGAKISGKIDVIENLLPKVDCLLIGGAMMFTFFKSQGKSIGKSLCEEDKVGLAGEILKRAAASGESKVVLPVDVVAAKSLEDEASAHVVPADAVPEGEMGVDIGPKTVALYSKILESAKTVVWNGPMGVFEKDAFAAGTVAIAKSLAASGAVSVIGGGDSAAAVAKAGVASGITHISTGGGASLEFLGGIVLPGVAALQEK
jgi:phosphoglycerate kinase